MVIDESPEGVPPVPSLLMASSGPSFSSEVTVIEREFLARLPRGAGLSAAEFSGDVTAIRDALAYRLAEVHVPNDGGVVEPLFHHPVLVRWPSQ